VRALKASATSESKRMFESDFLEFFSRIPPWQPPAIFLPVIAAMVVLAFAAGQSVLAVGGLYLVGLLIWTLMEYWLHRLVFHYEAKGKLGQRLIWILHGVHHDWPNDKMRLVFPPGLSIPLAVGFFLLFTWIFGPEARYAAFAGLATGYLAYDMIHYGTHHFAFDNPIMKYLRRYHMAHHHKHEPTRFGVTSPLWDYVFGTAPRS
jgi:sterol desaturase/sphingolipid hydroxylase (fatty acid hydroxylase superfamily)